jgi:hypothetical protein
MVSESHRQRCWSDNKNDFNLAFSRNDGALVDKKRILAQDLNIGGFCGAVLFHRHACAPEKITFRERFGAVAAEIYYGRYFHRCGCEQFAHMPESHFVDFLQDRSAGRVPESRRRFAS